MLLAQRGLSLLQVPRSAIQLVTLMIQLRAIDLATGRLLNKLRLLAVQLSLSCRILLAGRRELMFTLGQRLLLLLHGSLLLGDLLTGRLDLPGPLGPSRELFVMTTVQAAEPFDLLLNPREDVEDLVARGPRKLVERLSVRAGQWPRRPNARLGRVRVLTRGLIVVVVMLHSRALALVTAPSQRLKRKRRYRQRNGFAPARSPNILDDP